MRKSFKVEIQPTPTQVKALLQHAGNSRWAYNWGLAKRNAAYEAWLASGKPKKWEWPTAISLHKELNLLKKLPVEQGGVPWLYNASKCAPHEALRDLDRAFLAFFRRRKSGKGGGYPKFKSRNKGVCGFRLSQPTTVHSSAVRLPVIGRVRIMPGNRGSIPAGKYSTASVKEEAGRWFVSVVGPAIQEPAHNGGPEVGIDVGVANLATLSDGTVIPNITPDKNHAKKLRRLQKTVSRRQKGSSNRLKARQCLQRKHRQIRNQRTDYLHKVTTMLAKSHGRIVLEDLKVAEMIREGGVSKRRLNRSMADASLGEFRRMLTYKGKLYGCVIATVNPAYTSQSCSSCGYSDARNRQSQSRFVCLRCRHSENADLNAAKNILVAGSSPETGNACGEGSSGRSLLAPTKLPSLKQESAPA